jgi:hypothetical protein
MSHTNKADEVAIPEIIVDKSTGTKYLRGKFYGKVSIRFCRTLFSSRTNELSNFAMDEFSSSSPGLFTPTPNYSR